MSNELLPKLSVYPSTYQDVCLFATTMNNKNQFNEIEILVLKIFTTMSWLEDALFEYNVAVLSSSIVEEENSNFLYKTLVRLGSSFSNRESIEVIEGKIIKNIIEYESLKKDYLDKACFDSAEEKKCTVFTEFELYMEKISPPNFWNLSKKTVPLLVESPLLVKEGMLFCGEEAMLCFREEAMLFEENSPERKKETLEKYKNLAEKCKNLADKLAEVGKLSRELVAIIDEYPKYLKNPVPCRSIEEYRWKWNVERAANEQLCEDGWRGYLLLAGGALVAFALRSVLQIAKDLQIQEVLRKK